VDGFCSWFYYKVDWVGNQVFDALCNNLLWESEPTFTVTPSMVTVSTGLMCEVVEPVVRWSGMVVIEPERLEERERMGRRSECGIGVKLGGLVTSLIYHAPQSGFRIE
jgi:hypothetical protein